MAAILARVTFDRRSQNRWEKLERTLLWRSEQTHEGIISAIAQFDLKYWRQIARLKCY